jgi:gamma-glutamyltranspeptidase
LPDHGTGSVKDALAPAIRIARDGFPMYEWLHDKIKKLIGEPGILELPALEELWKLFLNDDKDDSR